MKPDVKFQGLVEQSLLTQHLHHLNDVLGGDAVELAALDAGIGKGVQAHMGDVAHLVPRDVPVELGQGGPGAGWYASSLSALISLPSSGTML